MFYHRDLDSFHFNTQNQDCSLCPYYRAFSIHLQTKIFQKRFILKTLWPLQITKVLIVNNKEVAPPKAVKIQYKETTHIECIQASKAILWEEQLLFLMKNILRIWNNVFACNEREQLIPVNLSFILRFGLGSVEWRKRILRMALPSSHLKLQQVRIQRQECEISTNYNWRVSPEHS